MASGVAVEDECLVAFEDMKMRRKYKYVIMGMKDNDKKIGVLQYADKDATYDAFAAELQQVSDDLDCRYALYDFDFQIERSGAVSQQNKILFYVFCPDNAKIKRKMLYSSSKDALKKKLQGISMEIQACDFSEIQHGHILEKVLDKERN